MNRRFYLLLSILVWASNTASAQERDATLSNDPTTSLSALVQELQQKNAEIQAARYRYEAATKRPSQVSTLPEPKLSFTNFGVGHPVSRLNSSDFAYQAIGVSQEVPFPGKLALAAEEAQKDADSEGQMYRNLLLESTARLKVAYYEWFSVHKAIETTKKNRELMKRLEEVARSRYSVGKGIQQDVLKAQVELSLEEQQLELLEQRRGSIEAQINFLLNRSQEGQLGKPVEVRATPFPDDLQSVLRAVEINSPRIRAQQLLVDSRAVGVNRSQKEYRPDFNFGFQWQHTGSLYPDYYMATAEVKIPLYSWRKQRYGSEEAQARLQESRQNYQSTKQEALFLAKDQFLIAKTSERILALYESGINPQATLSLESSLAGYQVGKVDFLTLMNSAAGVSNYERQYYEELAKHEQALARLEPLIGREIVKP
jgi:cobalt-zinc-cadmium efflux system outer membrane protein